MSRGYSIRSVTTDLIVKISGVDVEVEYLEDYMNFDFYEQDLDLLHEIQTSLDSPTTEQISFFQHMNYIPRCNRPPSVATKVELLSKTYVIDEDDDCLSDSDEEPTTVEDQSKDAYPSKASNSTKRSKGLTYFSS